MFLAAFTAKDDAIKEIGGNISHGVRRVLDALYGTKFNKKITAVIDGMNEVLKSQNRLQEIFDEQDEKLAEIFGQVKNYKKTRSKSVSI
jgi:hypothetical protein